jgi:hypothetical protein
MRSNYPMYGAFKKDLQTLKDEVGPNRWLLELESFVKVGGSWNEERRLVDRIDESLKDNSRWRNIRTASGFHGKNNY